jgi:hypothetical protein
MRQRRLRASGSAPSVPRMSTSTKPRTGGCLCGAVRYEATGDPTHEGFCCCADCRKASGSGFIGFIGFPASQVRITGKTMLSRTKSFRGADAVRNHCVECGSLVFGGIVGVDTAHTIYAGSLDDPSRFHPAMAIFMRDKADWVILPEGLTLYDTMPG